MANTKDSMPDQPYEGKFTKDTIGRRIRVGFEDSKVATGVVVSVKGRNSLEVLLKGAKGYFTWTVERIQIRKIGAKV